jgi:hypothetical protein
LGKTEKECERRKTKNQREGKRESQRKATGKQLK